MGVDCTSADLDGQLGIPDSEPGQIRELSRLPYKLINQHRQNQKAPRQRTYPGITTPGLQAFLRFLEHAGLCYPVPSTKLFTVHVVLLGTMAGAILIDVGLCSVTAAARKEVEGLEE